MDGVLGRMDGLRIEMTGEVKRRKRERIGLKINYSKKRNVIYKEKERNVKTKKSTQKRI